MINNLEKQKLCKELQDEKYTLVLDSQDIKSIANYAAIEEQYIDDITGAIVEMGDGDYNEIWFTEDNRPYDLDAIYRHPSYWYD